MEVAAGVLQCFCPDDGVGLHDRKLFWSVLAVLEEDAIRDPDFANVVQGSGVVDVGHEGLVDAVRIAGMGSQGFGQNSAKGLSALDMRPSIIRQAVLEEESLALFMRNGGDGLLEFGTGQGADVGDAQGRHLLPRIAVKTLRSRVGFNDPSVVRSNQQHPAELLAN